MPEDGLDDIEGWCATWYEENSITYEMECVCPGDGLDADGNCPAIDNCYSGILMQDYYNDTGYMCACYSGIYDSDYNCIDCPMGTDADGACLEDDCMNGFWACYYGDDGLCNGEYYCVSFDDYYGDCFSGNYSADGYCADWCSWGYDAETFECIDYEEQEWDMFSEKPFYCIDPYMCSIVPPGSDDETW